MAAVIKLTSCIISFEETEMFKTFGFGMEIPNSVKEKIFRKYCALSSGF